MPLSRYFHGHGEEVINNLKDEYGEKKGTSVFYALANSNPGNKPPSETRATSSKSKFTHLIAGMGRGMKK